MSSNDPELGRTVRWTWEKTGGRGGEDVVDKNIDKQPGEFACNRHRGLVRIHPQADQGWGVYFRVGYNSYTQPVG